MEKKTIIINGENFSELATFYLETDKVLSKNLEWQTGHNLDAFSDLLEGGFGVHGYKEPIKLIWKDFSKSRLDLGKKLAEELVLRIEEHDHIEFSKA